jgi:cob(I)alamin adenosyltransferase
MTKKISITTRGGDKGESSLYSGERLPKDSPRFMAIGDVDELGAFLGVAKLHAKKPDTSADIVYIQETLFILSAEIATTPERLSRLKRRIDQATLAELDSRCTKLEARVDIPPAFVLSGESLASAHLDCARAVARRCERRIVKLSSDNHFQNDFLLAWINRLSDFLFLLARYEA